MVLNEGKENEDVQKIVSTNYIDSLIELLDSKEEFLDITDKIKIIKILNKCISVNRSFKIPALNKSGIIKSLMELVNFINQNSTDDKTDNKRNVIVFLFTLKRFRHLTFSQIFNNISIENFDPVLIDIFSQVIGELEVDQENISEIVDYLQKIKNDYKELEFNLINLKLINMFLDKKSMLEFEDMAIEIIKTNVLKKDETINATCLKTYLKLLIDFLTKFNGINITIDEQISEWLDFYFFRLYAFEGTETSDFSFMDDKELMETFFSLLLLLSTSKQVDFKLISSKVEQLINFQIRRGNVKKDWDLDLKGDKLVTNTSFKGIANLGCTCYINSLVQQLYMNPLFASFILQLELKDRTSLLYKVG